MRLQVKGKNVDVSPSIREYAERKLAKLEKQLAEQTQVEVSFPSSGTRRSPKPRRRGDDLHEGPDAALPEASPDMKASIDQLVEKLARQVKRYRERRVWNRAVMRRTTARRPERIAAAPAVGRRQGVGAAFPSPAGGPPPGDERGARARSEPPGWDGDPRGEPGIHGIARVRRWDAVVTGSAPGLEGDTAGFVALADDTLAHRGRTAEEAIRPWRTAVERRSTPPYRAEAGRQEGARLGGRGVVDRRSRGRGHGAASSSSS